MWGSTSNSQSSKPWKITNQSSGSATQALLGAHHRFHQEHVPRQIPEDTIFEEVGNTMPYPSATGQANVHEDVVPLPPSSTMQSSENGELPRTLWMGDLDPSFNERTIELLWGSLGKQVRVKLIRAKKNLLIPCSTASATHAGEQYTQGSAHQSGAYQDTSTPASNSANNPVSPKTASASININGTNFIDPNTTQLHHAGYCFVEFDNFKNAQHALTMNSKPIPNVYDEHIHRCTNSDAKRTFRLNWASGATLQSIIPATPEYSLFVGDLAPDCYEQDLLTLFQTKYASVKTVRVMTDPITGASRCFGFVRFQDFLERELAVLEMNGVWCKGRPLRVAYATPRSSSSSASGPSSGPSNSRPRSFSENARHHGHDWNVHETILANTTSPINSYPLSPSSSVGGAGAQPAIFDRRSSESATSTGLSPPKSSIAHNVSNIVTISEMPLGTTTVQNDSVQRRASTGSSSFAHGMMNNNMNANTNTSTSTTVFIGGLNNKIDEFQLYSMFQPFGKIVQVKIPHNKGCGFVKFGQRRDAEAAIVGLQGFILKSTGLPIRLSWGRETNTNTGNGGLLGSFDGNVAMGHQQPQQFLQQSITSPVGSTSEFGFPATQEYGAAESGPHIYHQDVFNAPGPPPVCSKTKRSSSLSYPMGLSQSLNMQDYIPQSGFGNGTFSEEFSTAFPQAGLQPNLYAVQQAPPVSSQVQQQQQQQHIPNSPGMPGFSAFDQTQQNITSSNLSQFPAFADPMFGMKRKSIDHHEWR